MRLTLRNDNDTKTETIEGVLVIQGNTMFVQNDDLNVSDAFLTLKENVWVDSYGIEWTDIEIGLTEWENV